MKCSVFPVAVAMSLASAALATPNVMDAFAARYPTSTLLTRTQNVLNDACYTCHSPSRYQSRGNCYREALKNFINNGMTDAQAIIAAESLDSDNDGVANRDEILAARTDMPGEIGYNPGLVGPTGISPCSQNSSLVVTNQPETPTPAPACPADLDNGTGTGTKDGGVDVNDLLYFLLKFEQGAIAADLDNGSGQGTPDGGVDINDLLFFLAHFEAGC